MPTEHVAHRPVVEKFRRALGAGVVGAPSSTKRRRGSRKSPEKTRQHIDDAIADQCTSNEPGTKSNTSKLREFRFKYFSVGFMVLRGEYVQPTW